MLRQSDLLTNETLRWVTWIIYQYYIHIEMYVAYIFLGNGRCKGVCVCEWERERGLLLREVPKHI